MDQLLLLWRGYLLEKLEWEEIMSLSDEATRSIRELSDNFCKYVVGQDFQSLAGLYTEDAVLMPPGQAAVPGRSDIRKFMEAFPPISKFEFHIDDVDGYEDLAYVRGRYLMVLTPKDAPGPVEDRGKYIEIRRKQSDGSWLMAVDIFNSDA
jgi:uncharacterized protein (TIGR02246 family)